ncbi:MFS transporter [Parasphingorhabdus sp.]|uniref:MFS transporter n=1 Tax=Parasphingorhabdus sp. TaxID=2709688 RepID=UPI00359391CF
MTAQPCMEGSKKLRLLTILVLYVAQGIPIGLFDFAIPAWMAANGATGAEIGYVIGMIGLPWSLKFINGFLMDRYAFLPMGRRRAWLIGAQVAMVLALLACALLDPTPRDAVLLGIVAFAVNSAVVFQDVAADALAVDMVVDEERGFAGGLMSGGQALGISISASAASIVIFNFGPGAAFIACATIMAFVTAYLVWIRERQGERRLPWSLGSTHDASKQYQAQAWWPLVKDALRMLVRPNSLQFIAVTFIIGAGYGTMAVAVPLIATNFAGWNEAQLGSANGVAQLCAALVTISLGGYLTTKVGMKRFQMVTLAIFASAILFFVLMQNYWISSVMMTVMVVGWTVLYFLLSAPQAAITMNFCDPKTGASQFSIYMAFSNQGISFAGFTFAFTQGFGGIPGVLSVMCVGMVAAMLLVIFLKLPTNDEVQRGKGATIVAA